ncbi:Tim44 domain-containing protein [Limnohabitans sp. T6-20]|jgi:predicted lipid-binding transport protein (Tim44 family)|uniref:Tim44 domain-containing protein n=1 Tax=Limnohabitans sp. T6-20 TaxID=1100725 RepID=UPI000D371E88|nr:Tim44-like domain-containing protein [Limnohabitans sp. T6-20]PUE12010.1 transporter [Limnohabitans sp. T6-20]
MNKLMTLILAGVLALGSLNAEAARRMGGGKSIGQQSSQVTKREAAPAAPAQNAAAANAAKPAAAPAAAAPKKPWGAMLGGLAAGLGLAWLAHSLGMGGAFGNVLMFLLIGVAVMAVIGMVMRSRRNGAPANQGGFAYQGAGASADQPASFKQYNPEKVGNDASARPWESQNTRFDSSAVESSSGSMIGSALSGSQSWGIPAGFDVDSFVTAAKRNFVTLQDAWDRSDISTLRSMMTDTMVAEIRSQLAEREAQFPGQPNKTEVVMLEAQLLGIEEQAEAYLASVEFNGMIREDASAGPSSFREVWNMTKSKQGGGWLVAGVQALQ